MILNRGIFMNIVNAELFLLDQFSKMHQSFLPTAIKSAYEIANILIRNEPILNVESAKYNHGRVRQFAVDLAIERLITSGKLPFDYKWKSFSKPTGKFLQI